MSQSLSGRAPIEFQVKTADYTVKATENGTGFTNTGATAAVTFALPPAVPGLHYYFVVDDTDAIRIDPNGTETISLPSSGAAQAAGAYITADAVGESVHILCHKAGTWSVVSSVGTWTAV